MYATPWVSGRNPLADPCQPGGRRTYRDTAGSRQGVVVASGRRSRRVVLMKHGLRGVEGVSHAVTDLVEGGCVRNWYSHSAPRWTALLSTSALRTSAGARAISGRAHDLAAARDNGSFCLAGFRLANDCSVTAFRTRTSTARFLARPLKFLAEFGCSRSTAVTVTAASPVRACSQGLILSCGRYWSRAPSHSHIAPQPLQAGPTAAGRRPRQRRHGAIRSLQPPRRTAPGEFRPHPHAPRKLGRCVDSEEVLLQGLVRPAR